MSNEMKRFEDRTSEKVNHRKLKVESLKKDEDGEISELVVVMERIDDDDDSGTKLSANNINNIIKNMISEYINNGNFDSDQESDNIVTGDYSIDKKVDYWIQSIYEDDLNYTEFKIKSNENIYINYSTNITMENVLVQSVSGVGTKEVTIKLAEIFGKVQEDWTVQQNDFIFNIYTDQSCQDNFKIGEEVFTIYYTYLADGKDSPTVNRYSTDLTKQYLSIDNNSVQLLVGTVFNEQLYVSLVDVPRDVTVGIEDNGSLRVKLNVIVQPSDEVTEPLIYYFKVNVFKDASKTILLGTPNYTLVYTPTSTDPID